MSRVDDAVEVVADLGERVLRRLALKIAELVDTAALHSRPRPALPDRPPQPGVTVNDGQHRRPQPARDEVVKATFPRRERFASAQLQGDQMLAPIEEDADDAEHRRADHLSGSADAQREAV